MKRSDILYAALLLPLDFAALVFAFLLAYYLRTTFPDLIPTFLLGGLAAELGYTQDLVLLPFAEYLPFISGVSALSMLIFALSGLYRVQRFSTIAQSSGRVIRAVAAAFVILLMGGFIFDTFVLPRLVILYTLILSVVLLVTVRGLVQFLRLLLLRYGFGVLRVAVLGQSSNAKRARQFVGQNSRHGHRLTRAYTHHELESLYRALDRRSIDELIVADHHLSEEELIELRERCIERRVGFLFVPSALEVLTANVAIRDVRGYPVIEVPLTPLEGWGFIAKRIFDVLFSLLFLLILSPLILAIAIAIYLDDPGPVFFRHQRLGQELRPFKLLKFRTMRQEFCDGPSGSGRRRFNELLAKNPSMKKEWEETQKLRHDPRVTKVGQFLRRFSLDELPQVINIIKGDISLVGPRPIVKKELVKYGRLRYRLSAIKPGLTGLWQVSGRSDTTYEERVRLDMIYVETWSLWLDMVIVFKTAGVLIRGRGAY